MGKKIEAFEMKMSLAPVIVYVLGILGLTSLAFLTSWGNSHSCGTGPHGFTALLYAYASTFSNNGSYFGNIEENSLFYNITTSIAMLAGRYLVILPTMALAGSLAKKKKHPENAGSFPASGITFILLLLAVYLIINAVGYLPSLLIGPTYEHFLLLQQVGG